MNVPSLSELKGRGFNRAGRAAIPFLGRLTLLPCHPEAHLLREGTPEMLRAEMHSPGSSTRNRDVQGGGAEPAAIKSDTSREVLRGKDALQDDSPRGCGLNLALGGWSNAWSIHD
jgi:hypothetical protein